MRLVCISDTHGDHLGLTLPDGDVLIHAGDFCPHGSMSDCTRFFHWLNAQPHQHKICIAGNHDLWLERANDSELQAIIPPDVRYLNDSGTEINGINFWGSPVQPRFFNWAFNRDRGEDIKKHWDLIPENTDVLITHGPAYGYCDKAPRNGLGAWCTEHTGCQDLLEKINEVRPAVHVFGHIHFSYGHDANEHTYFLNASLLNESYQLINRPHVLDLNTETGAVESLIELK